MSNIHRIIVGKQIAGKKDNRLEYKIDRHTLYEAVNASLKLGKEVHIIPAESYTKYEKPQFLSNELIAALSSNKSDL